MYYLIIGTYQDEKAIEGLEYGNFEWVVEADNQESAISQLENGETLISIREISVEERIKREEQELLDSIKREYVFQIVGDLPIREASRQMKELNANPEIYYLALKSFNKRQRLMRVLKRQKGIGSLSMTEYSDVLKQLIDANNEENFNKVLSMIEK
jgi:hypothetical protein